MPEPFRNRVLAALTELTRARIEATIDIAAVERPKFTLKAQACECYAAQRDVVEAGFHLAWIGHRQ